MSDENSIVAEAHAEAMRIIKMTAVMGHGDRVALPEDLARRVREAPIYGVLMVLTFARLADSLLSALHATAQGEDLGLDGCSPEEIVDRVTAPPVPRPVSDPSDPALDETWLDLVARLQGPDDETPTP